MALELIHTSAVAGLHGRGSGFCTVAMTTGMPALLEQRLEALGGYRPTSDGALSPPCFSHLRLDVGGRNWHVLTSVRAAPPDPSGRANKLAHHLALTPEDLVDAGPAWLLRHAEVVIDHFDGPPQWIPQPRPLPQSGRISPRRADAWQRACGDAGWAGALVNQFLLDPSRISCVVHGTEIDALELVDEAISLLPPAMRWRVTFATHFQQSVAGAPCAWRFCVAGTPAALEASRRATGLYLDMDQARRDGTRAGTGRYMELARSGAAEWWSRESHESHELHGSSSETAFEVEHAAASPAQHGAHGVGGPTRAGGDLGDLGEIGVVGIGGDMHGRERSGQAFALPDAHASRSSRSVHGGGRRSFSATRAGLLALLLIVVALFAAIGAVLVERVWWSNDTDGEVERDRSARLEQERNEVRAEVAAIRQALDETQTRLADAAAREREFAREHDEMRRQLASAEARLRAYEGVPGDGTAPDESTNGVDERAGAVDAAPTAIDPGAPAATNPGAPTATEPAPTTGADGRPPALGAHEPFFPAEAMARQVSHLGVISGDRRTLLTLAAPIASLRVEFPPLFTAVSTAVDDTGRSVSLFATGGGGSAGSGGADGGRGASGASLGRRAAATVEAEGSEVFFRWDARLSPSRHAPIFDSLDEALPFMTIVATLDDGSTLRVAPTPAVREAAVGRGIATTTPIGARSISLRLAPVAIDGWTLDPARTSDTSAVLVHASGSLHAALDPKIGRVSIAFLSPLHDELEAAERELKSLEIDRPNVTPDERAFHESAIRDARQKVDTLHSRVTKESPRLPASLPTIAVEDRSLGRTVVIIHPVWSLTARGERTP